MTWLPTTNLIQTDLLTEEQRDALKAWPHGIEVYLGDGMWGDDGKPIWIDYYVYRGKPAPVVTSIWFNVYPSRALGPYYSREVADSSANKRRIDVLRIDTCNGVSTAHREGLQDE